MLQLIFAGLNALGAAATLAAPFFMPVAPWLLPASLGLNAVLHFAAPYITGSKSQ